MDAFVVHQIVKVLPDEEQNRLFVMLKEELQKRDSNTLKSQKTALLTDEEATMYLLKNVFGNGKNS